MEKIIMIGIGIVIYLILFGIVIYLIPLSGYNTNQINPDDLAINPKIIANSTSITEINKSEWKDRCWEETMWLCQEHCSKVSGLKYSDFLTIDLMQFDKNNDSIINGSEEKEMKYIRWRNDLCMDECQEEEVYECFK